MSADDEEPEQQFVHVDDGEAGPAAIVCGEIVAVQNAAMAVVVLVICEDSGVIGIDVASGERDLPPSCAAQREQLRALIEDIRDYAAKRINGQSFGDWLRIVMPDTKEKD